MIPQSEGPPIVTKAYDVTHWLLPQVTGFLRSPRFVFGDRVQQSMLEILEALVETSYRRSKRGLLEEVVLKLERLLFPIRLSKDLKLLSLKKYEYPARELTELGATLGGWMKHQWGKGHEEPS